MTDVIDIKSARPGLSLSPTRHKRFGDCRHGHVVVDEHTRSVYCSYCKAQFEAFEILLDMANGVRRVESWRKELSDVRNQLKDLNRQIKNAKDRLKRAAAKQKAPTQAGRGDDVSDVL